MCKVGVILPWSQFSTESILNDPCLLRQRQRTIHQKSTGSRELLGRKLMPFKVRDRVAKKRGFPEAQLPQQGPTLLCSKNFYIFKSLFHTAVSERPFCFSFFFFCILELFRLDWQIKSSFIVLMCKTFPAKKWLNYVRAKVPTQFFQVSRKVEC